MNYFENREERKEKAVKHTEQMSQLFLNRIANCVKNSRIYGEDAQKPTRSESKETPKSIVV